MAITGPHNLEPIGLTALKSPLTGASIRRVAAAAQEQEPAESARLRVRNLFETGLRLNNQKLQEVQSDITRNQLSGQNIRIAQEVLTQLRITIEELDLNARIEENVVQEPLRNVASLPDKEFQGESLSPGLDLSKLGLDQLAGTRRETALARLDGALAILSEAAEQNDANSGAAYSQLAALTVERENLTASISQEPGGSASDNLVRIREELDTSSLRVSVGRESVFALIG